MLRVCGITFTHSPNYGSCLQTYALQNVIESQVVGEEACSYKVIPIQMLKDYPATSMSARIIKPFLALNRLQYQSFYNKYMKYVVCNSIKDLPQLNNEFDAFVCGSDVIWNDSINRRVGAYFLDFAQKYRFSYAASFGKAELSDEYIRFIGDRIDRLDRISVREASAVQLAMRCTDKQVTVVSDPVLLVDRTVWQQIAEQTIRQKPYIFVYATHLNDTVKQFLAKLESETHLPIIWAVAGPKQALRQGILKVQTPQEWLGLLHGAEYIVTNSFHATAFSVLFHKRFFTVVYGDKSEGINVRMNDFLNQVGLGDRIFSDVPQKIDLGEIDYTAVDGKVGALREESLAFLRDNLEAAYRAKMSHSQKE